MKCRKKKKDYKGDSAHAQNISLLPKTLPFLNSFLHLSHSSYSHLSTFSVNALNTPLFPSSFILHQLFRLLAASFCLVLCCEDRPSNSISLYIPPFIRMQPSLLLQNQPYYGHSPIVSLSLMDLGKGCIMV